MKNQQFNEVLLAKALTFKHGNSDIPDQFLDHQDAQVKQVCAKLSISLSDSIDSVCGVLDMSKRAFIELALINAVAEFESIASEYDIFGPHTKEGDQNA
jgi:hypothetical protein